MPPQKVFISREGLWIIENEPNKTRAVPTASGGREATQGKNASLLSFKVNVGTAIKIRN